MLSNHKCFGVHLYPPSAKTGTCVTLGIQGLIVTHIWRFAAHSAATESWTCYRDDRFCKRQNRHGDPNR